MRFIVVLFLLVAACRTYTIEIVEPDGGLHVDIDVNLPCDGGIPLHLQ
jgi:hypothetical protein